jgi:hypothetical protein
MTKPSTSPCAPQPKQWKKPFWSLTVKDGVFSSWNGQSPVLAAALLQPHPAADQRVSKRWPL